jgi:tetratricopeptide (TPR) repeat protein
MEDECSQWERLANEFLEAEKFYQAANQFKNAASCFLDRVLEMTKKAAEYYHMHAEDRLENDDHRAAATAYLEAATQYRQISDFSTAMTLYENAAKEALLERMTETAAQAYLWAAYSCHKTGNREYFLTAAENMGNLYDKAADKAIDDGNAERAVINLSLAAMGFVTIEKMGKANERLEKARKIINKTRWEWLETLLSFSEALSKNNLDDAEDMLETFKEEEAIEQVMRACLSIRSEIEKKKRRAR